MAVDNYNAINKSKKEIMLNNFLGGISWAVGTAVGASLIVGLITLVLTQLKNVDIIGPIIETVMEKVEEKSR